MIISDSTEAVSLRELLKGKTMVCDICGHEGARIRHVTRSYGKGKKLFVIENVPVITCSQCGESYLTADTLHEIERIKIHRSNLTEERKVPVAVFG